MRYSIAITSLRSRMESESYAENTIRSYVSAVGRFMKFVAGSPSPHMVNHIHRIASYLESRQKTDGVSPSTINVEYNALFYFHNQIIGVKIPYLLPPLAKLDILSPEDVHKFINGLSDPARLVCQLIYGMGLRPKKVVQLRLRDVDTSTERILIRNPKGEPMRSLPIPISLLSPIQKQYLESVHLWKQDVINGISINLPRSREKQKASTGRNKEWYWLFPEESLCTSTRFHRSERCHISIPVCDFDLETLRSAYIVHTIQQCLHLGYDSPRIKEVLDFYLGTLSRLQFQHYLDAAKPKNDKIRSPIDVFSQKGSLY